MGALAPAGPRDRAGQRTYDGRMRVRFYPHPETGEPHVKRHGVSCAEAVHVIVYSGDDGEGRRDARVAVGLTEAGR